MYTHISKEQMTNLYLYGTETAPVDKLNPDLIRGPDAPEVTITMQTDKFMSEGAGRFANGASFGLVRAFMNPLTDLQPGTHSGQDAQGEGGKPTRMYLIARSTQDVWPGNFFVCFAGRCSDCQAVTFPRHAPGPSTTAWQGRYAAGICAIRSA